MSRLYVVACYAQIGTHSAITPDIECQIHSLCSVQLINDRLLYLLSLLAYTTGDCGAAWQKISMVDNWYEASELAMFDEWQWQITANNQILNEWLGDGLVLHMWGRIRRHLICSQEGRDWWLWNISISWCSSIWCIPAQQTNLPLTMWPHYRDRNFNRKPSQEKDVGTSLAILVHIIGPMLACTLVLGWLDVGRPSGLRWRNDKLTTLA